MQTRKKPQPSIVNPDRVALLVIDVQRGLFAKATPIYRAKELLTNINLLADRAHRQGIPVLYVQHSDKRTLVKGSDEWQLHSELRPAKDDGTVHKQHGSAFLETGLDEDLKSRKVGTVVVAGLVTHGCVRATCLHAKKLGYRVILVQDGHSNYSPEAPALIEEWNRKLGERGIELKSADSLFA